MKKIIFKANGLERFRAPKLNTASRFACLLYALTRIETRPYIDARRAYKKAWAEHSERLQAEIDAVRLARVTGHPSDCRPYTVPSYLWVK